MSTDPSRRPRHEDPEPIGRTMRRLLDADHTLAALLNLGGKRWTKAGRDRVYFTTDQLYEAAGGTIAYYKTGSVMTAWLPEFPWPKIANNWAEVDGFYDLLTDRWNLHGDARLTEHMTRRLNLAVSTEVERLTAAAEAAEAAAAQARAADTTRPLPSLPAVLDRLTPEQMRTLAQAALVSGSILGHRLSWSDPVASIKAVGVCLDEAVPGWLPPVLSVEASDARWWSDLLGVDYSEDIAPDPEEG